MAPKESQLVTALPIRGSIFLALPSKLFHILLFVLILIAFSFELKISWHRKCIIQYVNDLKWERKKPVDQPKGIADMKNCKLNLTMIHSEKLRNIVGQGGRSPYQIWISPGRNLGVLGTVAEPAKIQAANEVPPVRERKVPSSWLHRLLLMIPLQRS